MIICIIYAAVTANDHAHAAPSGFPEIGEDIIFPIGYFLAQLCDRVEPLLESFRPGRERERDKAQLISPNRDQSGAGEKVGNHSAGLPPLPGPPQPSTSKEAGGAVTAAEKEAGSA